MPKKTYANLDEGRQAWEADRATFADNGIVMPQMIGYMPEPFRRNFPLAMDALAPLLAQRMGIGMDAVNAVITTDPNSSVPAMLTTLIDPEVFEVRFAPNKAVEVFGEAKKGSWTDETTMFPIVEHTGEVSSYGDYSESGHTGANTNWPQRQSYRYQTIKEYGELESERAGLAKLNWVSEMDKAAATTMNKFENLTYFFGVSGLQNYGLLNDPGLTASLTPLAKSGSSVTWDLATANEIFDDVKALITQLITQNAGLIDKQSRITLALSPKSEALMAATNSFNVNVSDLIKKNYPGVTIKTAMQYGARATDNPQGNAAGELMQAIAADIEGQKTGYCSFSEKMRAHPVIRALSSFRQKISGGTWGAIIRQPSAIATMVGI